MKFPRRRPCVLTVLVNESRVGSKAAPAGQDLRTHRGLGST